MTNPSIIFKQIRVGEMSPNSGVFIGNNNASFWGSFGKTQTGLEISSGTATRNRVFFSDRDNVDIIAAGPAQIRIRSAVKKEEKSRKIVKPRPLIRRKRLRRRPR